MHSNLIRPTEFGHVFGVAEFAATLAPAAAAHNFHLGRNAHFALQPKDARHDRETCATTVKVACFSPDYGNGKNLFFFDNFSFLSAEMS